NGLERNVNFIIFRGKNIEIPTGRWTLDRKITSVVYQTCIRSKHAPIIRYINFLKKIFFQIHSKDANFQNK
ncbi:hypothetical protein ACJX0J_018791, partial [Zea mays]